MAILLTGAFGNVGKSSLNILLQQNQKVKCFDLKTAKNQWSAKKYKKVKFVWGDISNPSDVKKTMTEDIEAVIHLAAIIPPGSEKNPLLAYKVNVLGTLNILDAIRQLQKTPQLIFASSVSIYGNTQDQKKMLEVNTCKNPIDEYSRHKSACEKIIKSSGIPYTILRYGAVLPLSLSIDPIMYDVPLDTKIEFLHTYDAGRAAVNAIGNKKAFNKTFLIGGGKSSQLYYREMMRQLLETMGIGMLPDSAFGKNPYYTGWMNTKESEKVLKYQQHDFKKYVQQIKGRLGVGRYLTKAAKPLVRKILLKKSPYYSK
ncbi:MAG: NAD(P)-dependent oxidoreductase [Nanoarchaeota archaeon]|nr:NAD(P)-dependent oxidoreductase [Nanoarchaeota archaeon]MBU1643579.1 NAD(P)-dependent oxidoreductase [Nanoarchaeota archaeon]MBU1977175.1 NAD(P)-dependent oxidoreductase [Nanoarchaeota archaeon]